MKEKEIISMNLKDTDIWLEQLPPDMLTALDDFFWDDRKELVKKVIRRNKLKKLGLYGQED